MRLLISSLMLAAFLVPQGLASGAETSTPTERLRTDVFPLFRFERSDWGVDMALLDIPFVSLLEYEQSDNRTELNLLPVPFASMMRYKESTNSDGDSQATFTVLDVPFAHLVKTEQESSYFRNSILHIPFATWFEDEKWQGGEREISWIHVAFAAVFRGESDGDDYFRGSFLDITPLTVNDQKFGIWLWSTEVEMDKSFDHQFLHLPLIGPMFGYKKDGDERSARFLFLPISLD